MTHNRQKSVMIATANLTARTSCSTREACLVVSFPVANQLLCRGSSSFIEKRYWHYFKLPFAVSISPAVFRKTVSLFRAFSQVFIKLSSLRDITYRSLLFVLTLNRKPGNITWL